MLFVLLFFVPRLRIARETEGDRNRKSRRGRGRMRCRIVLLFISCCLFVLRNISCIIDYFNSSLSFSSLCLFDMLAVNSRCVFHLEINSSWWTSLECWSVLSSIPSHTKPALVKNIASCPNLGFICQLFCWSSFSKIQYCYPRCLSDDCSL